MSHTSNLTGTVWMTQGVSRPCNRVFVCWNLNLRNVHVAGGIRTNAAQLEVLAALLRNTAEQLGFSVHMRGHLCCRRCATQIWAQESWQGEVTHEITNTKGFACLLDFWPFVEHLLLRTTSNSKTNRMPLGSKCMT